MDNTDSFIEKDFSISDVMVDAQTYNLPHPESMFKESPWQLDNLQRLKNNLNEVKSRLNNYSLLEWNQHTSQMNEASDIVNFVKKNIKAELVTQAWCKFYEIISKNYVFRGLVYKTSTVPMFNVKNDSLISFLDLMRNNTNFEVEFNIPMKSFTSVHLCEAPGAFVAALNHWFKTNKPSVQWDWLATTLNPYYEGNSYDTMIADDRLIRHTLKQWCFGANNTGDIMDLENLDALVERSKSFSEKSIRLITADGSIDCTNVPAEQESTVAQLHFCETVACLHLLNQGGTFILKVFTLFEHQSVCLMYLLACVFDQVIVTKPMSSKAGNSERYVVCKSFKDRSYIAPYLNILRQHYGKVSPAKAMFNLRDIPRRFLQKIEDCNKFFNRHQCQVINYNIKTYEKKLPMYDHLQQECKRKELSAYYINRYKLKKIKSRDQIVGRKIMEINNCFRNELHSIHLKKVDSYNERLTCDVKPQTLLYRYFKDAKEIKLPITDSYNWNLQILPESLEIQIGKPFNKVRSSYFCNVKILQMLNGIDDIMQHMHLAACFSPAEITTEVARQMSVRHEILNLEFNCDSHRMIVEICDRLEKLEIGQTLILIGYSLLTQFNIALLCLLENTFNVTTIEIQHYRGYYIELKAYQHNEKVLNHLYEILTASHQAREKNMAIWSIMPITNLYECDQVPMIMQLNHLMIKLYTGHVSYKFLTQNKEDSDEHKSIDNEGVVYKHDV
nr:PREDICTED: cap-specific mRNA (nucleoside-2'-O-)-methyltransferase 2 isoform X1 [Linepithema humile]